MTFFNYAIIGAGPAGMAAALTMRQRGVRVFDVGHSPSTIFDFESLTEARQAGEARSLLGSSWQMLGNLLEPLLHHPKLRAEGLRYVADGERFNVLGESGCVQITGQTSYAAGGLANAWGAQLLRYTQKDLDACGDWPIKASELNHHYNFLEEHVGISGLHDDLDRFLGADSIIQPPIPLVDVAEHLFRQYELKRDVCNSRGLYLGHPRLAVLTQALRGRRPHHFGETEFFTTDLPGVYSPRWTLDELKSSQDIEYFGGQRLVDYEEFDDYVAFTTEDCQGHLSQFKARHLLLACGTLNTASLLLRKFGGSDMRLPFIDHPPTLLPVFVPRLFGAKTPSRSYPIQAVAFYGSDQAPDMISLYYTGGMLRSDLLMDMPLPIMHSLDLLRVMTSGMIVAQIWRPARASVSNGVAIDPNGRLIITYPDRPTNPHLSGIAKALRPLGAYAVPSFASEAPAGWGFHYAGTLPMRDTPAPYETYPDGRLWNSRRVRIIDGSVLPSLPAKNLSLTIMANAARIATDVLSCEY